MYLARLVTLFGALLLVPACGSEAGASGNAAGIASQLNELLAGVKDKASAEAAKAELGSLTDKLGTALGAMKSDAPGADAPEKGADPAGAVGDMAKKAEGAVSPELTKAFSGIKEQISRLMGMAEVKAVLGPTLEKLQGLLPG